VNTIARPTRSEYRTHGSSIARAIPDGTSSGRLLELQARYENERDPLIAALPVAYREAVAYRLRTLLAALSVLEPTR
jgi:hypothetical protein